MSDNIPPTTKSVEEIDWQVTDAVVWAKEFNRIRVQIGLQPDDEGWLIGWFANAIMTGVDEANRRNTRPVQPTPDSAIEVIKQFAVDCCGDMEGADADDFNKAETMMLAADLILKRLGVDFNPINGKQTTTT